MEMQMYSGKKSFKIKILLVKVILNFSPCFLKRFKVSLIVNKCACLRSWL